MKNYLNIYDHQVSEFDLLLFRYAALQRQKAASASSSSSITKSNASRTVSKPPQQTYLSSIGSELNRQVLSFCYC